jgi:hypothetical protein
LLLSKASLLSSSARGFETSFALARFPTAKPANNPWFCAFCAALKGLVNAMQKNCSNQLKLLCLNNQ